MEKSENKIEKNYSIGLDIGTTSVGWAVINSDTFEVLKGKTYRYEHNSLTNEKTRKTQEKALWGVRLFEEASTAEGRRGFRSTRRRYDRRRKRIRLLQELFKEEIDKVDPNFFRKLKDSFYSPKDLNNKKVELTEQDKKEIFNNYKRNIDIKEEKKYPTIYHLRYALMNSAEQMDIRQVYLGLHHIIKYRGNFLYDNDFDVDNVDITTSLKDVLEMYNDMVMPVNICDVNELSKKIEKVINNANKKQDSKEELQKTFESIVEKTQAKEWTKLLMGYKFNINNLLNVEKKEKKAITISFKGSEYEEKHDELEDILEDKISVLDALEDLYSLVFIKEMFKGSNASSISELMIEYYNKHANDLKLLKGVLKPYKKEYKDFFKSNEKKKCTYELYISNNIEYNNLKSKLEKIFEDNLIGQESDVVNITEELENETFLPKITSKDNGKYPYQFNLKELRKIIENQGKYYPFLKEIMTDADGKDTYKIEKILTFRIPYYVGPLNNQTNQKDVENPNAWLIRNEDKKYEQITPYNFHEVIDKEKTAEKFITRMVGKCTYINNEEDMPMNSIYYSKYKVIQELKQIKVNDVKLTKEHILDIYNDLFLHFPTIKKQDLEDYLRTHKDYKMYPEYVITGFQTKDKFASNMKSYLDFFGENGIFVNTDYTIEDAENIIRDVTIFEDKDLLKIRLERDYPNLKDLGRIDKILKLKYKKWSSLSKRFLDEKFYINELTHEKKSIMDLLLETDENLMQIINNEKYKIQAKLNELNSVEKQEELSYDVVKDLATSPSNKRGIYQALKVVEEIVKYMGCDPQNISIEMARGDEEKKRTESRKEQLQKVYKELSEQIDNYNEINKELESINEKELDKERVFLYFLQCGKSLYSMKKLNLEDISDKNKYEVDHIIPQTLIKDNSIDNKALVLKEENQVKKDSYVLPREFRTSEMKTWWKKLHDTNSKLMSNKKLFALTREEFTKEQIEGFINRQLVETRQICKHVANILNTYYDKTKIIYLHTNLSSDYRKKFELYKFRDLNDYHHAHDAYLAVCLGIYQDKYVNKNIDFEKLKELSRNLYESKNYKELNYGYVVNSLDNGIKNVNIKTGEVFDNKSFNDLVEKNLYRNDIMVTKKTEYKTGEFYNQTIYSNNQPKAKYRIKENLPVNVYGGYNELNYSYMILVKYKKKSKLLGIPVYLFKLNDDNKIKEYISNSVNYKDFVILKDKIPFNHCAIYNNQKCIFTSANSKSVEIINGSELKLNISNHKKYNILLNFIFNNRLPNKKDDSLNYEEFKEVWYEEFNKEINKFFDLLLDEINNNYPLYIEVYNKLSKTKEKFYELKLIPEPKGTKVKDEVDSKLTEEIANKKVEEKELSKVEVIKEICKLLKCTTSNANLKMMDKESGLTEREGRISRNVAGQNGNVLITQSYTGIKETYYEF